MVKQSSSITSMVVVGLLVIAAIFAGLWIGKAGPFAVTTTTPSTGNVASGATGTQGGAVCPSGTLTTNLRVTQYNPLNTTATQVYSQTALLYNLQSDGTEQLSATLTDLTGNTTIALNCGDTYRLREVSSDSANSIITAVRSGQGATLSPDGKYVQFTATNGNYNLEIESPLRAAIKVKAFDQQQNGWIFANDGQAASAYRVGGVTFESTTNNATPTSIAAGSDLHWTLDLRAASTVGNANDFGMYLLVDASTSVYNTPVVTYNGKVLQEVKGNLDTFESRAFSSYEYVYKLDGAIVDHDGVLDFDIAALNGITPSGSDDLTLAFAGVGAVKQTAGNGIRYASTTDASSPTPVFTLQTFGINIG